jgi:hypothetical protein
MGVSKNLNPAEQGAMPSARPWNMTSQQYSQPGNIARQRGCFAFMFTNIGNVPASVNGMVVYPNIDPVTTLPLRGDSVTIGAHVMDLYKGNINLKFDAAGGTTPLVEITQLFYTDLQ